MCKYKTQLVLLVASLQSLVAGLACAETWYLQQSGRWEQLKPESKDAFANANRFVHEGKLTKAAKNYEKFLDQASPDSDLYMEALKRQFSIAKKFLSGHKKRVLGILEIDASAEGVKMMEQISERAPDSQLAVDAAAEVAMHYEKRGRLDKANYELAYLKWRHIFETHDHKRRLSTPYPTGELGKDALLAMARCKHLAYRGPKYDASDLVGRPFSESPYDSAKGCYEQFRLRYPQAADSLNIAAKLEQIEQQVAQKDLYTAQYYRQSADKQSANLYYQMVIRNWPGTAAAEAADEMLTKNLAGEEKTPDE